MSSDRHTPLGMVSKLWRSLVAVVNTAMPTGPAGVV